MSTVRSGGEGEEMKGGGVWKLDKQSVKTSPGGRISEECSGECPADRKWNSAAGRWGRRRRRERFSQRRSFG